MRRILIAAIAVLSLALAAPGAALAAHGHRGVGTHHRRHQHHRRGRHGKQVRRRRRRGHGHPRAKRARFVKFAPLAPLGEEGKKSGSEEATEGGKEGTEGEGTPSGPAATGEVASFEGGVLTVKLADGTLVKGAITEDSHLLCMSKEALESRESEGDRSSGDDGEGDHQSSHDGEGDHQEGTQAPEGEEGGSRDGSQVSAHDSSFRGDGFGDQAEWEGGDGNGAMQRCEPTALVPGAIVREAELRLGSAGAMWEKVVLLK